MYNIFIFNLNFVLCELMEHKYINLIVLLLSLIIKPTVTPIIGGIKRHDVNITSFVCLPLFKHKCN